jgi:hypothetical protein
VRRTTQGQCVESAEWENATARKKREKDKKQPNKCSKRRTREKKTRKLRVLAKEEEKIFLVNI